MLEAATGICSDRQFLGVIDRLLAGWFPHLPDQSQYNRRLRRLAPWITTVQLQVAELMAEGQVRLVDGTLIACGQLPRLREQERVRRARQLRLLPLQEEVFGYFRRRRDLAGLTFQMKRRDVLVGDGDRLAALTDVRHDPRCRALEFPRFGGHGGSGRLDLLLDGD